MKTDRLKPLVIKAVAAIAVFLFFYAIFWWLGAYNFTLQEQMVTFFYDKTMMLEVVNKPGGLCEIIGDFLTQFFVYPHSGIIITAALLTLVSLMTAYLYKVLSGSNILMPLAVLPSVAIAMLHYNINYMYGATVAWLFVLVSLCTVFRSDGKQRLSSTHMRLMYTMVGSVIIYATCGAIATLYALSVSFIALLKAPKKGLIYLVVPAIVLILGYISVIGGEVSDLGHALLPEGYYTHRFTAPAYLYTPYCIYLGLLVMALLLCRFRLSSPSLVKAVQGVSIVVVAVSAIMLGWSVKPLCEDCRQLCDADACQCEHEMSEEYKACRYMQLSDKYYSQGQIAQARRYAFVANQALENTSPRMLQRMVDTNMVFGDYKVAEKYLSRLDKTLYYRDWAKMRRAQLNDQGVASDPELSAKRACISSGRYTLDDDLKQISDYEK